ncbi:hypothetical protein TNIN_30132 [Trichonephila inaurata madagascariensis]|uniref:Uncharacterized protein n=1 Tax=Trichonephila inaurata madagascariensis TaxID=2747483 RepID=A0A8X6Y0H4_9ARAC|nr:hypothetical protein TNIN_30132 [Trichonephila inaurata madagascariensis]
MAMNTDNTTDMDYQHATLPNSGNSTPERPIGPTPCARLEATKADIRRYTLIAQGFENMLTTLRQSNAQDEDIHLGKMLKKRAYYENPRKNGKLFFVSSLKATPPGSPKMETPPPHPQKKSQPTKRKDEKGVFISLPREKVF